MPESAVEAPKTEETPAAPAGEATLTRLQVLMYGAGGTVAVLLGAAGVDKIAEGATDDSKNKDETTAEGTPADGAAEGDTTSTKTTETKTDDATTTTTETTGSNTVSPTELANAEKTYAEADQIRSDAKVGDQQPTPGADTDNAWLKRVKTETKQGVLDARMTRRGMFADIRGKEIANNAHDSWFWGNTENMVALGGLITVIGGASAGLFSFLKDRGAAREKAEAERKTEATERQNKNDKIYEDISKRLRGPEEAWDNADEELLTLAESTSEEHQQYKTRIFHLSRDILRARKSKVKGSRGQAIVISPAESNIVGAFLGVLEDVRNQEYKRRLNPGLESEPLLDASDINLDGANLAAENFFSMNFQGASFVHAKLNLASIQRSNLASTEFGGAQLEKTRFVGNSGLDRDERKALRKDGAIIT